MSELLRVHGVVWAEFELVSGPFEKTLSLVMRKPGEGPRTLLQMTVVGNNLLYSAAGDRPVLTGKETEHASGEDPA